MIHANLSHKAWPMDVCIARKINIVRCNGSDPELLVRAAIPGTRATPKWLLENSVRTAAPRGGPFAPVDTLLLILSPLRDTGMESL